VPEDDHRHCKVCGKVCDPDEEVCSKACRAKRAAQLRTRQMYTYVLYGAMALILIVFLVTYH